MKQIGLKNNILILIFLNFFNIIYSQNYELCNSKWDADSLFNHNNFSLAKFYYQKNISYPESNHKIEYYYLACCYAKLKLIDSCVYFINKSIDLGLRYNSKNDIDLDDNLNELKETQYWHSIKSAIEKNIDSYNNKKPSNIEIKQELIRRRELDQLYRRIMASSNDSCLIDSIVKIQNSLDLENQKYLETIIKQYGWPDYSLVGDTASHVAWLIVQHSDNNVGFQEMCLPFIEKAVISGQAKPSEIPYLKDRILVNKGLPQIFGTQFSDTIINKEYKLIPKPISDIKNVDKFRYFYGLGSLNEYLRSAEDRYRKKYND
jgi:hypothetical protein